MNYYKNNPKVKVYYKYRLYLIDKDTTIVY